MPELPEVETLKRQLNTVLVGKIINAIEVKRTNSFYGNPLCLPGLAIAKIERKAKVLRVKFENSKVQMLIHLKMTGQLIYQESKNTSEQENNKVSRPMSQVMGRIVGGHPTLDWIEPMPSRHTRVIFVFADQSRLFFNDLRVFGWIKVFASLIEAEKELAHYALVEPLTKKFTRKWLGEQLNRSKRALKTVLMDQAILAGVGNIYANDALWKANLHPNRPANSLTDQEVKLLHQAVNDVIDLGIQSKGATESTYRQLDGLGGSYQNHFLTYKREKQPCFRCQTPIKKIKVGGRGTYYCDVCQK